MNLPVLYSDNHLLAVNKSAGQLTQGDRTGDVSLLDDAREWVRVTFHKPGNVYLGLVHRLDRPVSGVLLFARTSKAAARLSDQFRRRTVRKAYLAVVLGTPREAEATLEATLDGRACVLSYRHLATSGGRSLLLVHPKTGRKHQIRRQLASMGHPIAGDLRYGAREPLPDRSIGLHAAALTVEHPTLREPLTIEAAPPEMFATLGFDQPSQRQ